MDFEDFYNLTPGQRMAKRGSTASRPFTDDWRNQQLTDMCDSIVRNPFMRSQLGQNIDASVNVSKDGYTVLFAFTRKE